MADIRKGDLVKATKRGSETVLVGRSITDARTHGWLDLDGVSVSPRSDYDIEVLDRPLPPISDELLNEAVDLYATTRGLVHKDQLRGPLTAVINLVREYDHTHNTKESK